jgi:hypothetical protein
VGGVIAVAAHAAAGLVLLAGLTKLWRPGVTHDALGLARGPRASLPVRGLGVASGNAAPGGVADLGTATARLGDGFQPGSGATNASSSSRSAWVATARLRVWGSSPGTGRCRLLGGGTAHALPWITFSVR